MWFRRPTVDPILNAPTRLSTADYLCRLMEEQNGLLRELVSSLGHPARTIKASPVTKDRIRTDKDVMRVTRQEVLAQEIERAAATDAPWRSGPASDPTDSTSGRTPPAKADAPAMSPRSPSAP